MKSPRCESSSSPIGVSIEIGSLEILRILRIFSSGISIFCASVAGSGSEPGLLQDLARDAVHLVDGLDHVHRDADGARLVGDRARDRLPDPPGGVGRELVAAAVFELVHRLHQADVAFLDQVEELQAAVGVLLRDRDHQAQVGLGHLALGAARLGLARGHLLVDVLQVLDRDADLACCTFWIVAAAARAPPARGATSGSLQAWPRVESRRSASAWSLSAPA